MAGIKDIDEAVRLSEEATAFIVKYFGGLTGHGPPELRTDEFWFIDGGSVWHDGGDAPEEVDFDSEYPLQYADELVTPQAQKWMKRYVWVYVDNGSGDRYTCIYAIDKCLKLTDEQKVLVKAAPE